MRPSTARFPLLCLCVLLCTATTTLAEDGLVVATPPPLEREPVLIYDVTGGTLVGPIHLQLNVFSDGYASLSSGANPIREVGPSVETAWLGRDEAHALQNDLIRAGALRIEVPGSFCADAPITSVTVFRPKRHRAGARRHPWRPLARSHTYAYDCATGPHTDAVFDVNEIIRDFIDRHFQR
jgi:hypothetical protein